MESWIGGVGNEVVVGSGILSVFAGLMAAYLLSTRSRFVCSSIVNIISRLMPCMRSALRAEEMSACILNKRIPWLLLEWSWPDEKGDNGAGGVLETARSLRAAQSVLCPWPSLWILTVATPSVPNASSAIGSMISGPRRLDVLCAEVRQVQYFLIPVTTIIIFILTRWLYYCPLLLSPHKTQTSGEV